MYWGRYVAHDNNRDGMGLALAAEPHHDQDGARLASAGAARSARVGAVPVHLTGMGPYNAWVDPHPRQRMAEDGVPRDRGDDQARRSRRLDVGVLRRLGSELHVLRCSRPQRDRPLLRDIGGTGADTRESTVRPRSLASLVPAQPAAPKVKWSMRNNINLQQSALLLGMDYVATNRRDVSRELLCEETAQR